MSPADRTDSRIKTSGPANPAPNQARVQPAERTIDLRGGPDDPKLKAQSESTLADTRARYAQLLAAMKEPGHRVGARVEISLDDAC